MAFFHSNRCIGGVFRLVMSDEFDVVNRTFADGEDPTWTASDHSDDARCVGERMEETLLCCVVLCCWLTGECGGW